MTDAASRMGRSSARYGPLAVLAASMIAVAMLALATPGTARLAAVPDAPPKTDPTGPNPLGVPAVEDTTAATPPEDERGPPEVAPEEPTVALPDGNEAAAGELIVNYDEDVAEAGQAGLRQRSDATLESDFPEIDAEVVALPEAADTAEALRNEKERLEADPAVEHVDYNYVVEALWSPDDPYFRQGAQGNVRAVDALRAWNHTRGGTRVAVLDSGCSKAHYELNEGKVIAQTDKHYDDGLANDLDGHGTHVSSILAADTNNAIGIAGGAPAASILCAKVLGNDGLTTTDNIMEGMRWAREKGARVINMSLGGAGYQRSFSKLTASMYRRGIFVVAASGNDNAYREAVYPAAYPGVMGVGGTTRDGTERYLTEFGGSNWGPYVDMAAPGESIWGASVTGKNDYALYNGTSMATPHVAAAGALLAAKGARAPDIFRSLQATADDRGARGRDDKFGHGLVDYHGAMLHYLRNR